ncbi:hypothetical protein PRK78_003308 [Emydomyces testavorans]|uniref:Uncharacterized protein n=1 Tax=Emydomyces testavorans TaxID=2070801 RepID=A0AAF0DFT2_9EURO|nr:hypothetical protein PRK78_003308 [Emydomyces testavorans]
MSSQAYHIYGAPRIEQGLQYAEKEWDVLVSPQLRSFKTSLVGFYNSSVEPHAKYTGSIIRPLYKSALGQVINLRDSYLVPAHARLKPIIDKIYVAVHEFLVKIAIPHSRKGWSSLSLFLNGTLRPRMAGLYFENVEPQLVRIGAKLASYREGRKLKRLRKEVESSTTSSSTASVPIITSTVSETTGSKAEDTAPATTSLSSKREQAQKQIAHDLKTWQEKFAVAADKGCDELEREVVAILETVRKSGAIEKGEKLVSELETVSQQELKSLKTEINDIVRALPENASTEDEVAAQDALVRALRSSGLAIREQAHSLRKWFNDYDNGLVQRVSTILASTLDVLDDIRDLGLQEIGMRWAWMDGVTYKDWAKFHALKKRFLEWHDEVRNVGMQHEGFLEVRAIGDDIISRGMVIAEKAAKELLDLKEVGIWKIQAGDSSSNFEINVIDRAKTRAKTRSMMATEPSVSTSTATESDVHAEEYLATEKLSSENSRTVADEAPAKSMDSRDPTAVDERVSNTTETTIQSSSAQPTSSVVEEPESSAVRPSKSPETAKVNENGQEFLVDQEHHNDHGALADNIFPPSMAASAQATNRPSTSIDASEFDASNSPAANIRDDDSTLLTPQGQSSIHNSKSSVSQPSTTPAPPVEHLKEILSSANHELRSLVDSVSVGVRGSDVRYEEAYSILDEANARLDSAASAARFALSRTMYGSSLPTDEAVSTASLDGHEQQILGSAMEQLDSFSAIVDVYLRQVRNEWGVENSATPASFDAQPTNTGDEPRRTSDTT